MTTYTYSRCIYTSVFVPQIYNSKMEHSFQVKVAMNVKLQVRWVKFEQFWLYWQRYLTYLSNDCTISLDLVPSDCAFSFISLRNLTFTKIIKVIKRFMCKSLNQVFLIFGTIWINIKTIESETIVPW